MHTIFVNPQGEKSLKRSHPWIFSGAVRSLKGHPEAGDTVAVRNLDGQWLAWGAYSPHSQIRVRVWSFDEQDEIGPRFFRGRLESAVALRKRLPGFSSTTAHRWVNAESDSLPGLIVDQYGDYLVCQFLSAGTERWKNSIITGLKELMPVKGIYERSDADARLKEGLNPRCGPVWGVQPPALVRIRQGDILMVTDLIQGHKTGLYLDQAQNQALLRPFASEAEILNCFCYTGGFGIQALKGGAGHVTQIDASESALALSRRNIALNAFEPERVTHVAGNVFEHLRRYRDAGRRFDLIVLDPPKFVAAKGQLNRGCRGYKDINLLAFKLLRPAGILFTFSCSGLIAPMLFQKIVADAAVDAGRRIRIIGRLDQGPDHPVALNFPEGHYLKGLICYADPA